MDVKAKLAIFAFDLLVPLLVGYLCRYQQRLGETFFNKMILNNILVVYPVLSALSFWVLPLRREMLWLPVLGLAMGVLPGGLAHIVAMRKYSSSLDRGGYVMAAALSNLGTIGGLCVFLIYGETGYGYQQLVLLFQYILMFMFCYPLAQYYYQQAQADKKTAAFSLRAVLFSRNQLAVLGIICGAVLQAAGVPRPAAVGALFDPLVHLGAWTALIPVGYSLDFAKIKAQCLGILDLIPIKFLATPVLLYGLARPVITDEKMLGSLIVLACTPTAVNAVITSRIYHLNIHIAVAAFIVTTVLFLLVVYPVLFFLLAA